MEASPSWLSSAATAVRVALAVFVLAWIFEPDALRSAVPILIVFLIALGLELSFLVGAFPPGTLAAAGPEAPRDRSRAVRLSVGG